MLCALPLLAVVPPARGLMLITAIDSDEGRVARIAVNAGARLVGKGPWAGSLYIEADRAALLPAALHGGLILLSGSPAGCGRPNGGAIW